MICYSKREEYKRGIDMSIVVAWIRKVNNCEELVFISDSRLSGGQRWDQCPKMIETAGKRIMH